MSHSLGTALLSLRDSVTVLFAPVVPDHQQALLTTVSSSFRFLDPTLSAEPLQLFTDLPLLPPQHFCGLLAPSSQ